MKDAIIKAEPFTFINLLECTISKKVNEHATATICGLIDCDKENKYMKMALQETWVTIKAINEKKNEAILFCGIIHDFVIDSNNGVKKMKLKLIGGTSLMDLKAHVRIFQNSSTTYSSILSQIGKHYQDCLFKMTIGQGKKIGDIIMQYHETDWEFLKRIASRFHSCLIPSCTSSGIKYYFGESDSNKENKLKPIHFSLRKDIAEYQYKIKNNITDIHEEDAIYYNYESREIHDLGEKVILNDRNLYIFEVYSNLKGGELIHKYTLKTKNGFKTIPEYNTKIIGASLNAKIVDIFNDKVKAEVNVEGEQEISSLKWLPYSTVYSSQDGTGWYCMPEKGDKVRLYFPNEKEENAYIISAVHEESEESTTTRNNPDHKSIMNKYKKQIEFTPTSIMMTNNNGMSIKLEDDKGISIISNKAIIMKSEEAIDIKSNNDSMVINAPKSIKLVKGNSKMELADDVVIEGSQVKIQ